MKKMIKQALEKSPTPKHFVALDFINMVGNIGKPIDMGELPNSKAGPSNERTSGALPVDTGTPPGHSPIAVTNAEEEEDDDDNSNFYSFSSGDTDESGETNTSIRDCVTDSGTEGSLSPPPSSTIAEPRAISSRLALRF